MRGFSFTLTKLRFFPTRCAPAAKNMRLFALSPPEPDRGSERRRADEGRIRNPDSGLHRWNRLARFLIAKPAFAPLRPTFRALAAPKTLTSGNVRINSTLLSLIRIFGCALDTAVRKKKNGRFFFFSHLNRIFASESTSHPPPRASGKPLTSHRIYDSHQGSSY